MRNMNNNMAFNNKAWGRSNNSSNLMNQNTLQPQLMNQAGLGNMVQFPGNQQVFQNAMGLQQQNIGLGLQQMANSAINAAASLNSQIANNPIFQQVTYPNARGLNPTAFQTNVPIQNNQNNSGSGKQRVFTGKVTQMHDNFGLVDEEVMFQMNVCAKGSHPLVGDRVLVEAQYTPNMPFKWNASRIQVLSGGSHSRHSKNFGNNYSMNQSEGRSGRRRDGKGRERSRERDRDDDEIERKRRREDRIREKEKEERRSPIRKRTKSRSRSPKGMRRRARIIPRYMVQVPKINLDLNSGDVLELKRRYKNMYIPSDFFYTNIKWVESFPADKPFAINKPCSFHIMSKDVESVTENPVTEVTDSDYLFSAKVMLMSTPGLEEMYQKCCALAENKDVDEKDYVHPTRLINFLVGLRGKNETMAIGGAWSPSLDGENPEKDPSVLIRTAIRTCKSLIGIDLSNCTQWYRFLELYYRRSESTHKGKTIPARVETVVIFLPDVWSCLPTRLEWEGLHNAYRKQFERIVNQCETTSAGDTSSTGVAAANSAATAEASDDMSSTADEKEEESLDKIEPTHYSQLDPKSMVVNDLRNELKARNINSKGLKSQLVAKLTKALKAEAEKNEDNDKEVKEKEVETEPEPVVTETKKEPEEKKMDEKEKALLEKRYTLPEQPHIIIHPSKTAKSGKFDCTTMSLSLLLDYRPEDSKEHSFEVSLFAELFNEMLSRDFGFNIYKSLYRLPEKKEEKKEEKKDKNEGEGEKMDSEPTDESNNTEINKESTEKKDNVEEGKDDDKKPDKEKKPNGEKKKQETDDESEKSDKKREREKKKKDKIKLYTKDKHLLLSFVYFDQTQCGYIFDKDMEDLLYTLGLKQSRAQIKKLISKVIVRDSLHYRKLTDKAKDGEEEAQEEPLKEICLSQVALGNRNLLPIFINDQKTKSVKDQPGKSPPTSADGFVKFRGSIVDVGKLLEQLERSEQARIETEVRLTEIKNENQKLSDKYHKSNSTIKHLNSEVRDYRDKLRTSEDVLSKVTSHSKLYHQALIDIKDTIEPVLRSTSHKEDKKDRDDRDKKQEGDKSRWEKDREHVHCKKDEKDREKEKEKDKTSNVEVQETKSEEVKVKAEETKEVKSEETDTKMEDN
ncbi:cell division cycle and apoptosis regulator protein 1-like [Diorhabda sublineata]|uniref:cell division cycle and apoptosis regulator protein 1-like n=1 Tax=Diorhabda sublineata TaxID=1163346 RepID=UPI0024E0CACB|nr:cell division cycle and apoptosis regulator protein 1-like [Diorhabda sublineata]